MLSPYYGEIIIVGTVYKKEFNWYITKKDLWILDTTDEGTCEEERIDIPILNEKTAKIFFNNILKYKVDTQFIRMEFIKNFEKDAEDSLYNFKPALYVNFDQKQLFSMFPEYTSFEEYVPDGWIGKYHIFYDMIETKHKYWIINKNNYFEGEENGK
ncbi:hypothetical protein [Paenibacillus sp. EZ-K15]|uniref:hypothetical protein n=1 Tax=Paenibacillus sp. EZ-K15 TaxID=2044275 RepID=UPI000BF460F2|nr:hypothetical protein [Paenibacillus sp. EZ-K15]